MDLDELLGIDQDDPMQQVAQHNVEADYDLVLRLHAEREASGLSVDAMAASVGVDADVIRKMEGYTLDPTLSLIRRYAVALGVRIDHVTYHPEGS